MKVTLTIRVQEEEFEAELPRNYYFRDNNLAETFDWQKEVEELLETINNTHGTTT